MFIGGRAITGPASSCRQSPSLLPYVHHNGRPVTSLPRKPLRTLVSAFQRPSQCLQAPMLLQSSLAAPSPATTSSQRSVKVRGSRNIRAGQNQTTGIEERVRDSDGAGSLDIGRRAAGAALLSLFAYDVTLARDLVTAIINDEVDDFYDIVQSLGSSSSDRVYALLGVSVVDPGILKKGEVQGKLNQAIGLHTLTKFMIKDADADTEDKEGKGAHRLALLKAVLKMSDLDALTHPTEHNFLPIHNAGKEGAHRSVHSFQPDRELMAHRSEEEIQTTLFQLGNKYYVDNKGELMPGPMSDSVTM
eukprot:gene28751-31933_t